MTTTMSPRSRNILTVIIWLIFNAMACASDVSVVQWHGHEVIKLTGVIDAGTADRLAGRIGSVAPMPYGLPVLLLDSLGGLVDEAFQVSKLLDANPMHTVVPDGSKCASACASILFLAGKNRTVEDGGLLGQHSCSKGGVADKECNEELSNNAVAHGVSFGSLAAFVTYVPPESVAWFDREEADAWGVTRYPGEDLSGYEKSDPRVLQMLTGEVPPAQSAWRIDFRDEGFEAFARTTSDFQHEMQIDLFCANGQQGHLFLAMEIGGDAQKIKDAVLSASIASAKVSWKSTTPIVRQKDAQFSEVVTEIPSQKIKSFLKSGGRLVFNLSLKKPYKPMVATTSLEDSKKVLIFAANNCAGFTKRF